MSCLFEGTLNAPREGEKKGKDGLSIDSSTQEDKSYRSVTSILLLLTFTSTSTCFVKGQSNVL